MMMSRPHFFIFGYFGWFNVGDDAIGLSVVKGLKNRHPNAKFTITSNDPYFIQNFCGDNILRDLKVINFSILKILKEVIKSDYFIITGGTHFHDEGKLKFENLKILLSFAMLSIYAKFVRKPPLLLGHGIGPLSSLWSRALVKVILYNSKKIFVRDEDSFELARSLGFGEKSMQGFDCVATLVNTDPTTNLGGLPQRQHAGKIIGISLLPAYSIYSDDVGKDVSMVKSFAKCIESILMKDNSTCIHLFAFRTGNRHSDVPILEALMRETKISPNNIKLVQYDGSVNNFLNSIEKCDLFIGMRYHASLFAYLLHKPLIILDYMGKCSSLGRDIAIDKAAIIPITNILNPETCEKIQLLISNPEQHVAKLSVKSAKNRAENMFDKIVDVL